MIALSFRGQGSHFAQIFERRPPGLGERKAEWVVIWLVRHDVR